jgi:predicted GIY-YIG superfamily endonuclease
MKYYIYIIELDKVVGSINKFRRENPHFLLGSQCFYVGQSAKSPEARFKQHKDGYKSNRYAKKYGLKLVPQLYEKYNPIPTRKDAEELEVYVAQKLRKQGFGVWYN